MAYEADRLKLHKHKAAENIALLATCKAQEINPREYLNDVITVSINSTTGWSSNI